MKNLISEFLIENKTKYSNLEPTVESYLLAKDSSVDEEDNFIRGLIYDAVNGIIDTDGINDLLMDRMQPTIMRNAMKYASSGSTDTLDSYLFDDLVSVGFTEVLTQFIAIMNIDKLNSIKCSILSYIGQNIVSSMLEFVYTIDGTKRNSRLDNDVKKVAEALMELHKDFDSILSEDDIAYIMKRANISTKRRILQVFHHKRKNEKVDIDEVECMLSSDGDIEEDIVHNEMIDTISEALDKVDNSDGKRDVLISAVMGTNFNKMAEVFSKHPILSNKSRCQLKTLYKKAVNIIMNDLKGYFRDDPYAQEKLELFVNDPENLYKIVLSL